MKRRTVQGSPLQPVAGSTITQYISASSKFPGGASNFKGKRIYIDIAKLKAAGGAAITTEEVIADLIRYKTQYPHSAPRVDALIKAIKTVEFEALIKPPPGGVVPPEVLVKPSAVNAHYAGRALTVVAIAFTAYDLKKATDKSINQGSIKPVAAETIRQAGGWGGSIAGMAIGAKLFGGGAAAAGTAVAPGPGTGAGAIAGVIIGGIAGYLGADGISDHVDEN